MRATVWYLGWNFYALGPQLLICLACGYLVARRRHADPIRWLVIGFVASVAPILGAVAMLALLWHQYRRRLSPAAD